MASRSRMSGGISILPPSIAHISAAFESAKQLSVELPPSLAPICGGQHSLPFCWPGGL